MITGVDPINGYFHIAFSAILCILIVLVVLALATFYRKLHKRK